MEKEIGLNDQVLTRWGDTLSKVTRGSRVCAICPETPPPQIRSLDTKNCYLVSRLLICPQFLVAKGNRSGAVIISHSHPILPEGQGCQYLTVCQEKAPHRVIQATGDKLRL